ncbi:NADP-dependent aldehyde dehydrogenase [Cryobacterium sp. MP_M5]|uniref:aldehyde dehydrogenase family protein n=1 Tax=unclassified Cryobacterium TaxID=2649013 RepID=UPI0018CB869D|nr:MULTISPECIES: aldehyde dehydrogenase family protein [unclassified Cryobacterium]MBG6058913.1 NADP-dependent aldehyde dehydrogenase [Cryobacterium sp. MP_M3]MEC5177078.1 NADP-dependent aldehyde dehydrogenase [Cryobacterium sp. MP_M5]
MSGPAAPAADPGFDPGFDAGVDPSFDPRTGEQHGGVPHTAPEQVAEILGRAQGAAPRVAGTSPATRETWLAAIADALRVHEDELVQLAGEETGLGADRLRGELAKCAASTVFYGAVAAEGSYLGASTEGIGGDSTLSRWNIPVGPVAVFGASNFPFGFGVIGHDVASALGAGCPVIVKAHPAHPRLSVRLAELVADSLDRAGAPVGSYALVVGFDAGLQLVDAAEITAVAFTGSQGGGMALVARAAARGVPVFAEMGTVNPVFVTTDAAADSAGIAAGFVGSFTLGAGQFCTKPGLLFAPAGAGIFDAVRAQLRQVPRAPLLTAGIARGYRAGLAGLARAAEDAGAEATDTSLDPADGYAVDPQAFLVRVEQLHPGSHPGSRLLEECFGPVALVCEYEDAAAALDALARLQPSLVASVFTGGPGDPESAEVVARLLGQVGRVALNAWPTGVATSWSMQHGGPWPATSRSDATSVGAGALDRFVRPVAVQNADPAHLPAALHPDNPWRIPRRIDGRLTLPTA